MEEYLYPHFYTIENEHWWFAARQRILRSYLEKKLHIPHGAKLLDVGCGTGAILDMLSKTYDAYGQDISQQAIDFCAQRGLKKLFCGPLDRTPREFGTFDVVTSFDVIEHIDDDLGTLKQIHALLKDNGLLVITVPAFPSLWGPHDVVTHHKRRYRKRTLRQVVEPAGFAIDHVGYFNFFLFPLAWVRRMAARWTNTTEASDMDLPHRSINALLKSVFESEKVLLPYASFPFGLSLICTARRIHQP